MKYMLIITSVVALAVASHNRGLVEVGPGGPAPAPNPEPIAVGPAILEFEPIAIGPAPVAPEPIIPVPTPVFPVEDIANPAPVNPIVQIILNINGQVSVPGIVGPKPPIGVLPTPVDVVDVAPEPVDIAPAPAPEPILIGTPVLPIPAQVMPDELN